MLSGLPSIVQIPVFFVFYCFPLVCSFGAFGLIFIGLLYRCWTRRRRFMTPVSTSRFINTSRIFGIFRCMTKVLVLCCILRCTFFVPFLYPKQFLSSFLNFLSNVNHSFIRHHIFIWGFYIAVWSWRSRGFAEGCTEGINSIFASKVLFIFRLALIPNIGNFVNRSMKLIICNNERRELSVFYFMLSSPLRLFSNWLWCWFSTWSRIVGVVSYLSTNSFRKSEECPIFLF